MAAEYTIALDNAQRCKVLIESSLCMSVTAQFEASRGLSGTCVCASAIPDTSTARLARDSHQHLKERPRSFHSILRESEVEMRSG